MYVHVQEILQTQKDNPVMVYQPLELSNHSVSYGIARNSVSRGLAVDINISLILCVGPPVFGYWKYGNLASGLKPRFGFVLYLFLFNVS